MTKAPALILRDFSRGRITNYSVDSFLIPPNSVSGCLNFNFDIILGSAVVRPGTTKLGATVASGKSPLGLTNFVGQNSSPNILIAVFPGATYASIYYYDSSWHTSNMITLDNDAKCRFATLGGRVFLVNGGDYASTAPYLLMMSSSDGLNWSTVNCVSPSENSSGSTIELAPNPTLILSAKQRLIIAGDNSIHLNKDRVYFSSVIQPNNSSLKKSTTLARSSGTVTATCTAHGFKLFDYVTIIGATQSQYNGTFIINSVADANTFTYNIGDATPANPATGTIYSYPSELSWNTDAVSGDWIDINPDDGGNLTAFVETADQILAFKNNGMYRLDLINKSTDPSNIFNIGSVSQETTIVCNGICYFYSGIDIRRTNGGFPEQISRLGVQDFIDAIPYANQSSVYAGQDGLNVYFSIGNITLNTNKDDQRSYTNVVLKFSTRDETWSVHSYGSAPLYFNNFTTSSGFTTVFSESSGIVQTLNSGSTDNGTSIYYELETQEIDFNNRSHTYSMSDQIAIFARNALASTIQINRNNGDYKNIDINFSDLVNVSDGLNIEGNFFKFKLSGNTSTSSPVFQGLYIENITDKGMIKTQ